MSDQEHATNQPTSPDDTGLQKQAASGIVRSFLDAMQRRDLDAARNYLSPEFEMTFPGDARFTELEELVVWGRQRYLAIGKSYDRFDEAHSGTDAIVYCFGTLQGKLLDGSDFRGIRFIDRFTVRDNKLQDQQVWNDLGEVLRSD